MIKLYQFTSGYGLPNFSPFCMKIETYLRMSTLEHEVVNFGNTRKTPKGKLPMINDDGKVVADSEFIIAYLNEKYNIDFDKHLTTEQKAVSCALQAMMDEKFYWTLVYSRWIDPQGWVKVKKIFFSSMPPGVKQIAPAIAQKMVKKQLHGQGIGRHSQAEVYKIGIGCLQSLSDYLGDKSFIHGDEPTRIDASVFAHVASVIKAPMDSPLKEYIKKLDNLNGYNQRMYERYFPELLVKN